LSEFGHYATDDEKYPGKKYSSLSCVRLEEKKDDVVWPNNTEDEYERR
jgi:hypothetical protein